MAVVVERTGESREHTVPPPHENHVRGQVAKQSRGRRKPHDATQDFSSAARRFMFAAPLLLITGFAVFGQIGYGVDHYTPPRADYTYKLAIAIGAAFAIESISNYVQWQAHRSRLAGATARAATLSRWSYLIAAGVAFINYQHFCGPNLAPTPGALVFAAFSFSSPWLWGLYTKGAEDEQRAADGTLDRAGAVFASERWRHFPILTFRARRYSVMHNITDPVEAWDAFMAEYRREVTTRAIERRERRAERPAHRMQLRRSGRTPGETRQEANPNRGEETRRETGGETRGEKRGVARRSNLTPNEQTALVGAAIEWAAAQMVKTGSPTGWRSIVSATDNRTGAPLFPGLGEYAARQAARAAKDRVDGASRRTTR